MSHPKPQLRRPASPQPALEAALTSSAADPLRHALKLDALEQQLRPCLPPALAEHCRFANITGDRLVFVVDSPVWNARLRLASTELVEAARSLGLGVNSVTSRVSMQSLVPSATAHAPSWQQSPTAREALKTAMAMLDESSSTSAKPGT